MLCVLVLIINWLMIPATGHYNNEVSIYELKLSEEIGMIAGSSVW